MKELIGDLWNFRNGDSWTVITTNGFVKTNGLAVMGRGVAQQCAKRFPDMPNFLGVHLRKNGNHVGTFLHPLRIFTLPVKHNWWEEADLLLVERGLVELGTAANTIKAERVYLPRPGCGNGRLHWEQVKPLLLALLDDRFTVIELAK